jgi:hypothetical protein
VFGDKVIKSKRHAVFDKTFSQKVFDQTFSEKVCVAKVIYK